MFHSLESSLFRCFLVKSFWLTVAWIKLLKISRTFLAVVFAASDNWTMVGECDERVVHGVVVQVVQLVHSCQDKVWITGSLNSFGFTCVVSGDYMYYFMTMKTALFWLVHWVSLLLKKWIKDICVNKVFEMEQGSRLAHLVPTSYFVFSYHM